MKHRRSISFSHRKVFVFVWGFYCLYTLFCVKRGGWGTRVGDEGKENDRDGVGGTEGTPRCLWGPCGDGDSVVGTGRRWT